MAEQCNTCGSYDESVQKCQHCPTLICIRCRSRHESVCGEMQKRKARGEGPTIRNAGMTRQNTMPAALGAPYDLSQPNPQPADPYKLFVAPSGLVAYAEKMAAPTEPIDQAIAAVADLLKAAENKTGE